MTQSLMRSMVMPQRNSTNFTAISEEISASVMNR